MAKKFDKSLEDFFKVVSERYKKQPKEYHIDPYELKRVLEKASFEAKVIPSYHNWFAVVVGKV